MTFDNESEVLRALGITTRKALTPDRLPKLMEIVPKMEKGLAASILPKLTGLAVDGVFEFFRAAMEKNDLNQARLHEVDRMTLEPLARGYAEAATTSEREEHWARIQEVRHESVAKDRENKHFLMGVGTAVASAAAVLVLTCFHAARSDTIRA